jgi:hypothetical protein
MSLIKPDIDWWRATKNLGYRSQVAERLLQQEEAQHRWNQLIFVRCSFEDGHVYQCHIDVSKALVNMNTFSLASTDFERLLRRSTQEQRLEMQILWLLALPLRSELPACSELRG